MSAGLYRSARDGGVVGEPRAGAELHADVSFKTMIGRGSGKTLQAKFEIADHGSSDGFVVVQPFEPLPLPPPEMAERSRMKAVLEVSKAAVEIAGEVLESVAMNG